MIPWMAGHSPVQMEALFTLVTAGMQPDTVFRSPSCAIAGCLEDARIRPEAVQYVNAHGTGTAANDSTETKALHMVFGPHAKKLMVSSTKSMHGHALGGAGAIELAATIIALTDGFIPPTANYVEPDPLCDLDYVPNEARDLPANVAISNSFAFGGHNAVIAVRR